MTDDHHYMLAVEKDGDWFTYWCPKCGYMKKENFATDEQEVITPAPNISTIHISTTTVALHIDEVRINNE